MQTYPPSLAPLSPPRRTCAASLPWGTRLYVIAMLACLAILFGCRSTTPIHVWKPGQVAAAKESKVALAPLAGEPELAARLQQQLLAQRPLAKADVALFTAEQLAEKSPIRLASTAALSSELTALQAARACGANLLLQGEILRSELVADDPEKPKEPLNWNVAALSRLDPTESPDSHLLISWRVIDVASGATLGSMPSYLSSTDASARYPDLAAQFSDNADLLIAASAREGWKTLAPVVVKTDVRLSKPFLQPGALGVRLGNRAAKSGDWKLAEQRWERVAKWFPFSAAAHHNLAVAAAAREDFTVAKQRLQSASGIMAWRLPGETLFWLDQRHRDYHQAHGLPTPSDGWAFPEPIQSEAIKLAPPTDVDDLPWYTAIPFMKPPEWTWQAWLTQPWAL